MQPKTKAQGQQEVARLVSAAAAEEAYAKGCPLGSKQRARALLRADTRRKSVDEVRALLPTLPE